MVKKIVDAKYAEVKVAGRRDFVNAGKLPVPGRLDKMKNVWFSRKEYAKTKSGYPEQKVVTRFVKYAGSDEFKPTKVDVLIKNKILEVVKDDVKLGKTSVKKESNAETEK